ncbi:MAG: hypothetical protein MUD12_07830 [Spirochaetes bacterium]|nr:hypothetical protein [Spirochaetota bacterium]
MNTSMKILIMALSLSVALSVTGCTKKIPLAENQKTYAGTWVAADGTFITIYLDGGGDLKMSGTTVTGGAATITDDSITIGMGPIKKTVKLTEKPKQGKGIWTMKLDGNTFTRK